MADWANAATGALSGAATGFGVGGPIGGAVGGLLGGASSLFGNKKKKKKKLSAFDSKQKQLNDQQHQAILGEGPLADLYNYDPEQANSVFDQTIANPAQRNFAEKTVPSITGAFRSNGLQNSSYAGDSLSKAGRDVQESLNGLRSKYLYDEQNNARTAKRSAVEGLQNRQTFNYDIGQKPFDLSSILNSISPQNVDQIKNYFNKPKTTEGVA